MGISVNNFVVRCRLAIALDAVFDSDTGFTEIAMVWQKRDGRWLCIAAHITVHSAPTL